MSAYKLLITESIVKGVGKTIGSLAICGALALTWYAGTQVWQAGAKLSDWHFNNGTDESDDTECKGTQTNDLACTYDENKFKAVLNNLLL